MSISVINYTRTHEGYNPMKKIHSVCNEIGEVIQQMNCKLLNDNYEYNILYV